MNLEYLMIYQQSGLPIFSKCFKGFCALSAQEPALLSGFLTALQSFSNQVTQSSTSSLEAVKMGPTVMRFSQVLPSGHNIVIGLTEDSPTMAKEIFDGIQGFILREYHDTNWMVITTDFGEEFGRKLIEQVLSPLFHTKGGFEDTCPLGESCAMKAIPSDPQERLSIWGRLKKNYRRLWKRKGMPHTI
jgi:hypothetical protein